MMEASTVSRNRMKRAIIEKYWSTPSEPILAPAAAAAAAGDLLSGRPCLRALPVRRAAAWLPLQPQAPTSLQEGPH